jgi:hypothetical protein
LKNEMKKVYSSGRLTFATLVLWLVIVGCGLLMTSLADVRTESQSVKLEAATSANVQIDFTVGELTVQGGASDTSFRYNVADWQHDVDVAIIGGVGESTVNLPAAMGVRVNKGIVLVNVSADGLIIDGNGYVNEASGSAPAHVDAEPAGGRWLASASSIPTVIPLVHERLP